MSELADEQDLGSCAERRRGSSPRLPTIKIDKFACVFPVLDNTLVVTQTSSGDTEMKNSASKTRGGAFKGRFKSESQQGIARLKHPEILRYHDADHLPAIVRKYIQHSGGFGKPMVVNLHAVFSGRMKQKPDSKWIEINAYQYTFFDRPTRVFYISSKMFGASLDGLHLYKDNHATMEIKLASVFKVANSGGPVMDKSETVTYFNDMCLLAPATLIDEDIRWETMEHQTVRATYTNQSNTISAMLYFNDNDELVNFVSEDRSMATGKNSFINYRWSTPVNGYQDCADRKMFSNASAVWHTPHGEYVYAEFDLNKIEYNVSNFEA